MFEEIALENINPSDYLDHIDMLENYDKLNENG